MMDGRPSHPRAGTVEPWGSAGRWHRFIFPEEIERNFLHSLTLLHPRAVIVSVMHCDLECRYSTPPRTGGLAFYSYPWINPYSAFVGGAQHQPPSWRGRFLALETDLSIRDLRAGASRGKLGRLLRALKGAAGKEDIVLLNMTCLPDKLGDCAHAQRLLAAANLGAQVLTNDPAVDQAVPPIVRYVRSLLERAVRRGKRRRPGSVNLAGFPRCREKEELKAHLGEAGVVVNADIVPDIDLGALETFAEAERTVLFPEEHMQGLFRHLFRGLPIETLSPPAPFGMEGSWRWLEAVAASVGRGAALARHRGAWWRKEEAGWLQNLERAKAVNAGFVGTAADLRRFADPLCAAGVPVFAVLDEAGIGVETFLLDEGFRTPGELQDLLRKSASRIVYSDVFFDDRLTACGKIPFSIASFRMGPEGATRTLESLLGASGTPFYRTYAAYLHEPREA